MSILVSIITPCLNSEKTIERTILSVLNQSYKNIQYCVIDGESSDQTLKILENYQKLDSRLFFVSGKDNSMTEALNSGLRLAKGTIIATLNADDWYEPDAIKHVVEYYKTKPFNCLIGNTRFVFESSEIFYKTRPWLSPWLPAWYIMGCLTPECSVFYSSSCIENTGLFNEKLKYTQDFEYYLRIMKQYNIYYTDKMLSNFLISTQQYSHRLHDQMESEVLSYINYKYLRKVLGGSSLSSILQILFGIRLYSLKEFYNHIIRFANKNYKLKF